MRGEPLARLSWLIVCSCFAFSCSQVDEDRSTPSSAAPSGERWTDLAEIEWEIAPGAEEYRCLTRTLTEDLYLTGFTPALGPGTHHVVMSVRRNDLLPEGLAACDAGTGGERRLQGAGPGTQARALLPDGVAMLVRAGEQLHVNVHLFNPTQSIMRGTSGMRARLAAAGEVENVAEVRLIGPRHLELPRGRVTRSATCTLREPATVFSLSPHLHRLGVHATIAAHSALHGEQMLHDSPYDFDHQLVHSFEPLQLAASDQISIDCTFQNSTDATVYWGDGAHSEMCFAMVAMYPPAQTIDDPCSD